MTLTFEDQPADRQKMTFRTYREFAKRYWGESSLPDGVYARSKIYNNFALLLADQCPWHLVLRVNGQERTFIGPLFIQMHECLAELKESTPFVALFNRAARYRRFPGVAVQEALSNAVIHFDPSLMNDIVIELTEDVMTVTSPGGFAGSVDFDSLSSTNPRNLKTSMILERMGYAKRSGSGMGLIRGCYLTSGLMPVVINRTDSFSV